MNAVLRSLACLTIGALVCVGGVSAQQTKQQADSVSETFTVVGIDQTNRIVTLKDKDGYAESMYAGPEVQRFSELKVGDKVTFRYYESVVYQIQKPGAVVPAGNDSAAITRSTGARPGGTISRQMTATVTLQAIDLKTPAVTIKMEDGSMSSFKVDDKKNLDGVKVGDRVQITYTQALAISVK